MFMTGCKDKLPEILVFREQNARRTNGKVDDDCIACALVVGGDSQDIMAAVPQGTDHANIATLIGEKAHEAGNSRVSRWGKDKFRMRQCVSRIGNGRMNRIGGQMRISHRQFLDGGAFRQKLTQRFLQG